MNLVVLPEAEAEASDAANWYEEKQSGLGHSYLDELQACFHSIESNPTGQPFLEIR